MTTDESGWDPFEVWYTRVCLPRKSAERAKREAVRSSADTGEAMAGAVASLQVAIVIPSIVKAIED